MGEHRVPRDRALQLGGVFLGQTFEGIVEVERFVLELKIEDVDDDARRVPHVDATLDEIAGQMEGRARRPDQRVKAPNVDLVAAGNVVPLHRLDKSGVTSERKGFVERAHHVGDERARPVQAVENLQRFSQIGGFGIVVEAVEAHLLNAKEAAHRDRGLDRAGIGPRLRN